MSEPQPLQQLRYIRQDFVAAEEQRKNVEGEADLRLQAEIKTADAILEQARQTSAENLAKVEKVQRKGRTIYAQWAGPKKQISVLYTSPPAPSPTTDFAVELTRSADQAIEAVEALEASIDTLEQWKKRQAKRRRTLTRYAIAILLILAGVGFFLYRDQQAKLQQLARLGLDYEDPQTLLRESYYQSAIEAINAGRWDTAATAILELNRLELAYKDIPDLIQKHPKLRQAIVEHYIQLVAKAIETAQWDQAHADLTRVLDLDPANKDAAKLLIQVLFRDRSIDNSISFNLHAPEENAPGPNTRMEFRSVEFFPIDDGIRLNLRIVVESGTFATIYKPDKVYVRVSGESIQASDFGGFFGTGISIGQLRMGGKGDTADGWIEFKGALSKIAAVNCFEFHYGKYYNFTSICIKR